MTENKFETSITELESIVKTLEEGDLSLDEMIKLFEKGMHLSADCNKMLDEAEGKINILVKQNGGLEKQEFSFSEEQNEF